MTSCARLCTRRSCPRCTRVTRTGRRRWGSIRAARSSRHAPCVRFVQRSRIGAMTQHGCAMRTDQATLILSSLLRSPRRFQSYDLPRLTKELVLALDKLLEEFQDMTELPDCPQALAKLEAA